MENRLDTRLKQYLKNMADKDWGEPAVFGGRTCFQAIPALELELTGEMGGNFAWEWIDYSLDLLRNRKDCQDFAMVGLLRMLYRYQQSTYLTGDHRQTITGTLLAAKFAIDDPGEDSCCWHTENHQVQYASSELLLGQLFPDTIFSNSGNPGCWHRERAREKLCLWLDWRQRFSFSEWNSSCYYDEDGAALLNLAEYAEDSALREQAATVFNQMLLHVALNSWRGMTGGSQGRAYREQAIKPDSTPMATLAQVCWGDGDVPKGLGLTSVLLAAGSFRPSGQVIEIGADQLMEMENRERHSLDAEEASDYGVHPDRITDYMFFAGSGQDHHQLVAETRYVFNKGKEKWPGFFDDYHYYRRCRESGEPVNRASLPHALGHADVYTYKTPDYMLGCVQAFRPGSPGYQQLIWSATLGKRAVVFTNNPAPPDVPYGRPGPWVGNGVLPKVVQHRNVLIALYRIRPCPIYDQPPWFREDRVHAWFPQDAFDQVVEEEGWCFARKGDAFIGLRPDKPAVWAEPEPELAAIAGGDSPYEWAVDDTDVAWVCELGSLRTHGTFADFVESLKTAKIAGGVDSITYHSPSLGMVATGWHSDLTVNGEQVNTRNYPRFDNPYLHIEFGELE